MVVSWWIVAFLLFCFFAILLTHGDSGTCISSARRQKGLTGFCFKYIDRPFCLQTNDLNIAMNIVIGER